MRIRKGSNQLETHADCLNFFKSVDCTKVELHIIRDFIERETGIFFSGSRDKRDENSCSQETAWRIVLKSHTGLLNHVVENKIGLSTIWAFLKEKEALVTVTHTHTHTYMFEQMHFIFSVLDTGVRALFLSLGMFVVVTFLDKTDWKEDKIN